MFLTKKALHRRTFLKGAQAALALPLLDAMIPASTAWAQTAAKPVPRLGFVFIPMGCDQARWTPPGEGNLDIWVRQVGGGDPIRLSHDPADDDEPDFSPDGTLLAFHSDRSGGGLYVVPALGGHTSHDMFADATIEYSIPYLSNNVHDLGLKWPF